MEEVHPLRLAYNRVIRKAYKQLVRGDTNPALTERAAMKIAKLGLDYNAYMDIAVKLCDGLAKHMGWKYPYFNIVVSDKTIERVKKLVDCSGIDDGCEDDQSSLFEYELSYASAYIDWWFGEGEKPSRNGTDIPQDVKSKVATYLCRMYGVPNTSSNYNHICKALETQRNAER